MSGSSSRGHFDRGWRRCIVVASGPSLSDDQVTRIVAAQAEGWRVFVANSTWRRIPSADVLFGSDRGFWNKCHAEIVASGFGGELWTGDIACAKAHGLQRINLTYEIDPSRLHAGLSGRPGTIRHHGNSGSHTLLLAHQFGMDAGILCGFDFQMTGGTRNEHTGLLEGGPIHHHGPHPKGLSNPTPEAFVRWAERLAIAARDLANAGVHVVNASEETALTCFERMTLDQALELFADRAAA